MQRIDEKDASFVHTVLKVDQNYICGFMTLKELLFIFGFVREVNTFVISCVFYALYFKRMFENLFIICTYAYIMRTFYKTVSLKSFFFNRDVMDIQNFDLCWLFWLSEYCQIFSRISQEFFSLFFKIILSKQINL